MMYSSNFVKLFGLELLIMKIEAHLVNFEATRYLDVGTQCLTNLIPLVEQRLVEVSIVAGNGSVYVALVPVLKWNGLLDDSKCLVDGTYVI